MKTNFTLIPYKKILIIPLLIGFISVLMSSCSVTEETSAGIKNTNTANREKNVKIYPDILKRMMHVRSTENTPLDFFVFDNKGTLMVHYKMQEKDHKTISGLDRGRYTYQVFKNEEMSESGKLIIK
jgi:hypothetical protein